MIMQKDYTKFSSNKIEEKVEEPVVSGFVQTEEVSEIDDAITKSTNALKNGVVSGCAKLNMRELPNLFAPVVCQLDESSELVIDEAESTDEFYAVYTASGQEGYCMKKFITLVE